MDIASQIETPQKCRRGLGRFSKFDGRTGIAACVTVRIVSGDGESPTISSECDGQGFMRCIDRAAADEFQDWILSAESGVLFALRALQLEAVHVTIERIEGFPAITSLAAVGVAAALAVYEAVGKHPPGWFVSLSDEMASSDAGVQAKFYF